jgi:hypothetical protein
MERDAVKAELASTAASLPPLQASLDAATSQLAAKEEARRAAAAALEALQVPL